MRKRNNRITVRFSDEEFAQLKRKIKKSKRTQNDYIVEICLNGHTTSGGAIDEFQRKNKMLYSIDKSLKNIEYRLGKSSFKPQEKEKIEKDIKEIMREVNAEWRSTRQSINQLNHTEL